MLTGTYIYRSRENWSAWHHDLWVACRTGSEVVQQRQTDEGFWFIFCQRISPPNQRRLCSSHILWILTPLKLIKRQQRHLVTTTMPSIMNVISFAAALSRAAAEVLQGASLASWFRERGRGPNKGCSYNLSALVAFPPHARPRSSNSSCDSSSSSTVEEDTYIGDAYGYFVDTSDQWRC
jgi:hypothetical protein